MKESNGGLENYDFEKPELDLDGTNSILLRVMTSFLAMADIV